VVDGVASRADKVASAGHVEAAGSVAEMYDDDEAREKRGFERSLREHGQLAEQGVEELPPGATHQVETDDEGREVLRRKRFSAF
jgi:hypothetical protein